MKVVVFLVTWLSLVAAQSVFITDPLIGLEGESLEFVCGALSATGVPVDPSTISIQRDAFVFNEERLTVNSNTTHNVYTFGPLMREDNGAVILCLAARIESPGIPIQVNYPPLHTSVTGPDLVDSVLTVVEGASSTVTITIEANPMADNFLERVGGENVPSSITYSGGLIMFINVNRADAGMYNFTSSNFINSSVTVLTLVVEYPPTFISEVSNGFMCDATSTPIVCASLPNESGSFNCQFESLPGGTLEISIQVPDLSTVNSSNSGIIMIESTSSDNAGNYTCTAMNSVDTVTRRIIFSVGNIPVAVTTMTPTVDSTNRVTIRWTHDNNATSVPITGFNITGGPIGQPSDIFRFVSPDVFYIEISAEFLTPSTDYRVSVVAISLLGSSEARDVTFTTVEGPTEITTSDGAPGTTVSVNLSVVLVLISVTTLHYCIL